MRNINLIASNALGFELVEFFIWCGAFALAMILTFIIVVRLRKFMKDGGAVESESALKIQQLEQMHTKGMISDEEFAAMRRGILGIGTPEEKTTENQDAV